MTETIQLVGLLISLVTALCTLVTAAGIAVATILQQRSGRRAEERADRTASRVENVKTVLETSTAETAVKLDGLAAVGAATHKLANNAMGLQLNETWEARQALADTTHDPVHIEAAERSRKLYGEYVRKQAEVDAAVANAIKGAKP